MLGVVISAFFLVMIGYYYGLSRGDGSTIRNIRARVILKLDLCTVSSVYQVDQFTLYLPHKSKECSVSSILT